MPSRWHTRIPTYAQVRYRNIYPGIDLVYYGRQGAPEYDFVVRPGANPARIRLAVNAESNGKALPASLDMRGNVVVQLPGGTLVQQAPVIYQQQGAQRTRPADSFILNNGQLGLRLGTYDRSRPLVIDPTLLYSTYLGGGGNEDGLGIAVDGKGNAYVTGFTGSSNFPLSHPLQTLSQKGEAFVTALSADGRTLRYSTYLGGAGGYSGGNSIAVDGQGNAYVTGYSSSPNFPLSHPFQTRNAGAFVVTLSADGAELRYSTYLGGSGHDMGEGIAVDKHGNAYVIGTTNSPNAAKFPLTHPLQARFGGYGDAFVAKISSL